MRWIGLCFALLLLPPAGAETKPPVTWRAAYSGNYRAVSYDRGIQYIVIHSTETTLENAIRWFQDPTSNVSSHYIVAKDGRIVQCVADKDVAWHSGNSYYNAHSIGIEHEAYSWRADSWTDTMYQASARLVRWLCEAYGIPKDRSRIVAHTEVPGTDVTKHPDPGKHFNWDYFMALVRGGTPSLIAKKCTASSLNVRSGPGSSYSILGQISSGQIYISDQASAGWHRIWFNGSAGWCYGAYLVTTSSPAARVDAYELNVRAGAGIEHAIVGVSRQGQRYARISSTTGWHQIYFAGRAVWISAKYTTAENY